MNSIPNAILALLVSTLPHIAKAQVGPNIDELAKELANPGAANATMNFKLEYRSFAGDLPGADNQNSTTFTFQPVLPFVLSNGNNLIFRPAFSYAWNQPRPNATGTGFSQLNAVGDIPFDLLYSWGVDDWTLGAGVVGSIPTGTDSSSDNWVLGPSFLAVRSFDWGVAGIFPFHNEKIGGSGENTSLTSLQYFFFYGLGDGWQIGTGPTIKYNWDAQSGQEWTVPVQLAIAKTSAIGSRLIKLNFSVERNVIQPDAFSEDWTATFTFSPVVSNPFQKDPPPKIDPVTRASLLKSITR
ncbi:MAG: hypothetical protein ABJO67_16695 [Pseudoruegeria sp.]